MRHHKAVKALPLILTVAMFRAALAVPSAPAAPDRVEVADDNAFTTCSLDPDPTSACSHTATDDDDDAPPRKRDLSHHEHLTHRIVPLTDETFDALTRTSQPGTWLIMFQSTACGLCRKARPVLEELAGDVRVAAHNAGEWGVIGDGSAPPVATKVVDKEWEEEGVPMGPVYAWEAAREGPQPPRGPVYIATVDAASWSGRDTAARFGVETTPTIIVVHNKGYVDGERSPPDARSYYVYRGQRATYPLRGFILGGFTLRRRLDIPPPLAAPQRKPRGYWWRAYDRFLSPGARWAGGIVSKLFLTWFVFMGVLGLGLRVHHYAWGDDNDDPEAKERRLEARERTLEAKELELERERARGREEHEQQSLSSQDEKAARRQKIMWERKAKNHERFAARTEARRREKEKGNNEEEVAEGEEEEEMKGVGFAVKKSDIAAHAANAKKL